MPTKPTQSKLTQFGVARQIITNSLNVSEILDLVDGYNYNEDKLNEGMALVEAAEAASNTQTVKAGAQKTATETFLDARAAAKDAYQALAKLARAVYVHDPAHITALGLDGPAPKQTMAFLGAAFTLFDNAATLSALADYGYDAARLASERAKITAMSEADNAQEIAKGEAQQATVEAESALKAMNEWIAQYRKILRIALRGKKQLLEWLGIKARTSLTAAQREGIKKAAATRKKKEEPTA
jgi:hypothetical protein